MSFFDNESVIRDLYPSMSIDLSSNRMKHSMRYLGSYLLNYRRPSKIPDHSRQYVHGDPVRLIDWKAFARTDQLVIREERDEASGNIIVCLDLSSTMNWPNIQVWEHVVGDFPTKLEIGLRLALHLSHLHIKSGDKVRFILWDFEAADPGQGIVISGLADVFSLYSHFVSEKFRYEAVRKELVPKRGDFQKADLIYWISDGLGGSDPAWLINKGNRIKFLHVLSSLENDTSWITDDFSYFDQAEITREYLGSSIKENPSYNLLLNEWKSNLKRLFSIRNGDYQFLTDRTKIRDYLIELASDGR